MANTKAEKQTDLILLLIRIPFLIYFAYEVFAKEEVSSLGYFAAFIGFSIATGHYILKFQRGRRAKKMAEHNALEK